MLVEHTNSHFIQPTADTRPTLYTCAGAWKPLEQDYAQRLVVVAELVQAEPRE